MTNRQHETGDTVHALTLEDADKWLTDNREDIIQPKPVEEPQE